MVRRRMQPSALPRRCAREPLRRWTRRGTGRFWWLLLPPQHHCCQWYWRYCCCCPAAEAAPAPPILAELSGEKHSLRGLAAKRFRTPSCSLATALVGTRADRRWRGGGSSSRLPRAACGPRCGRRRLRAPHCVKHSLQRMCRRRVPRPPEGVAAAVKRLGRSLLLP